MTELTTTKSSSNWLDPLNRMIWQKAFRARATKMTLRDGKKFTIRYEKVEVRSLDVRKSGLKDKAWVQLDGWVGNGPCGWFVVEEVLDPHWISDTNG